MDAEDFDIAAELQVKEVFAYFGRAMYAASCVEQALTIGLMQADLMSRTIGRARNTGDVPKRQAWEAMFDEFMEKHDGLMFGNLISRFRSVLKVDDELSCLLEESLEKRNHLAHSFFRENAVAFAHEAGCVEMISEMEDIHELFVRTEEAVTAAVAHVIPKLGIDPEKHRAQTEKIAEDLLSEARARAAQSGDSR